MKVVLLVVFIGITTFALADISGDAVLKKQIGKDEASITTTSRVAGAIHSFKFRGK